MKSHPLTRKHWYMVALGAVVLGLVFIWPFIGIVALSALMAFLFYGLFEKLHNKMRASAAATLTIVISIFMVIVPVALIVTFAAVQVSHLTADVSAVVSNDSVVSGIKAAVQSANTALTPLVGTASTISADGIMDFLRSTLPNLLRGAAGFLLQLVSSIPLVIILSIMFLIFMYEFLVNGKQVIQNIIALSPFETAVTRLYLERAGLMANAMAKGQLYISLIISLLSALVLSLFLGMGDYFFLMSVVFTLLNLVPLGCGIVVIPITIIAMLSGMVWQGAAALVLYIIISNLDAVIRPRIIPRSITLSAGLTMLAAFGGIAAFGLLGVVYGPILMIIIVTAVQMYLDNYKKSPAWRLTSKNNK